MLLSLSANVDCAKQLVRIFSNGAKPVMKPDLKSIIEQLEGAINSIGCDISSIPSSAFKNNYTELVVKSLSREMRNVSLQIKKTQPYEMVEPKQEKIQTEVIKVGEGNMAVAPTRRKNQRFGSHSSDTPRLVDFLKRVYYGSQENEIQSLAALTNVAEYIEPLYDTFFCPLTKNIMEDPVTIESGVTYERSAINEWFEKNYEAKAPVCPTTGMKLHNRTLSTNLALKTTIKEWTERNEAARLEVAHKALSLTISDAMVLDAVRDLQVLCRRGYREHMHNVGITELLTKFLEHNDRKVRSETLSLLQLLTEDDKGKEIIVKTEAIAAAVKMLSSYNSSERHASISFLLELSNSKVLCENIGAATGGIFMLITMKNKSDDPLVAEEAGATLKNLSLLLSSSWYTLSLHPLILPYNFILNELVLKFDIQTCVTEKMSADLIQIVDDSNSLIRRAALKALVLISSYETNNRTLIDAGIIQFASEKMFTRKMHSESMYAKEDLAAILCNILQSGVDPESIQVNKHGHTMSSDYFIRSKINFKEVRHPLTVKKLFHNFVRRYFP